MIRIMGVSAVVTEIHNGKIDNINIISIRDDNPVAKHVELYNLIDESVDPRMIHRVIMDDVESRDPFIERFVLPEEEHIRPALEFSKGKEDIIVHCTAGVSRSSAMAFLVECQRAGDPERAIDILNPWIHFPNKQVIMVGEKILGMELMPVIDRFIETSLNSFSANNE